MSHPDSSLSDLSGKSPPTALYYGLQPLLLLSALALWFYLPDQELGFLLALVGSQIILGVLEALYPCRSKWTQSRAEKLRNIAIFFIVVFMFSIPVLLIYQHTLSVPLERYRQALGFDIWPHHWPMLVQVLFAFCLSELMWYWIHRTEHRWSLIWRLSGHGAHHSFKRLGAINSGANHPLELFFIMLPTVLLELFFGAGTAAAGAAMLLGVQTGVAHTNMSLNTRVIGWLFTTPRYHFLHHSIVLEESNCNFGCSAILWDRIFGTFSDKDTAETGIGPTEPTTWAKFLMPVSEPIDSDISPGKI